MVEKEIIKSTDRIKERRLILGLSYQKLSDLTGISSSTIQRYEKGNIKNLPADKLILLANALETTPAYLIGWDKKDHNPPLNAKREQAKDYLLHSLKRYKVLLSSCNLKIEDLTDEQLNELAYDLVDQIKLLSYKYKKE